MTNASRSQYLGTSPVVQSGENARLQTPRGSKKPADLIPKWMVRSAGNWQVLRDVIAPLEERDQDLAIAIVHATMSGVLIRRSRNHQSGLWVEASHPETNHKFNEIKRLSMAGKGFRSKPVLNVIGRQRP